MDILLYIQQPNKIKSHISQQHCYISSNNCCIPSIQQTLSYGDPMSRNYQ